MTLPSPISSPSRTEKTSLMDEWKEAFKPFGDYGGGSFEDVLRAKIYLRKAIESHEAQDRAERKELREKLRAVHNQIEKNEIGTAKGNIRIIIRDLEAEASEGTP